MKGGKKLLILLLLLLSCNSQNNKKKTLFPSIYKKGQRKQSANYFTSTTAFSTHLVFQKKGLGEKTCKKFIRNIFNLQMGLHIAPLVQARRVVSCAKTVPTTFRFRTVQREAPKKIHNIPTFCPPDSHRRFTTVQTQVQPSVWEKEGRRDDLVPTGDSLDKPEQ